MADKTVACVIPTIGRPELARAVASVSQQSVDTEIIVVLDRPDEESSVKNMLQHWNVTMLTTSGGEGGNVARNIGVRAATSSFVAFLDDDDWWAPDKLEKQIRAVERADLEVPTVAASAFWFHRGSDVSVIPREAYDRGREDPASYLVRRDRLLFGQNAMQTSSLIVSKQLALDVGWRTTLRKHQDWDFIARCLRRADVSFVWVPEPLVHVVQGSAGSISRGANWEQSLGWLEEHREHLSAKAAADFTCVHVLRSALCHRDRKGIEKSVALMRTFGRPHLAALAVGLSGVRGS